jgi:hypothetical protein
MINSLELSCGFTNISKRSVISFSKFYVTDLYETTSGSWTVTVIFISNTAIIFGSKIINVSMLLKEQYLTK